MNQSVSTYSISTYRYMLKVMEVPVSEHEAVIEGSIAKYGIKWIYNRKIVGNINEEEESASGTSHPVIKHRKRHVTYSCYMDYNCNRYGKKEEKNYTNLSGKQRILQKASKKISCPSRLKVTCFKKNLNTVTLKVVNEHNHKVGGSEDINHLPLSKDVRVYIEDRLREGYGKRETRLSIQKNYRTYMQGLADDYSLSSSTVLHRDQTVHADEIYNIYKKIQENFYKHCHIYDYDIAIYIYK